MSEEKIYTRRDAEGGLLHQWWDSEKSSRMVLRDEELSGGRVCITASKSEGMAGGLHRSSVKTIDFEGFNLLIPVEFVRLH